MLVSPDLKTDLKLRRSSERDEKEKNMESPSHASEAGIGGIGKFII